MAKKKTLYDKWMTTFQKMTFKLENTKFKILNHFPNYLKNNEKRLYKTYQKQLAKASNDNEKILITSNYKASLANIRKEAYRKENINYHFDKDNPQNTLYWLNRNKKIHKNGIIKNLTLLPILLGIAFISNNPVIDIASYVCLAGESVSLLKNINCVLLQKYNLKRVQRYIDGPFQKRKKRLAKKAQKYCEATKIVTNTIQTSESLPLVEDIVKNIQSKDQAQNILELVREEINYRNHSTNYNQSTKQKRLKI